MKYLIPFFVLAGLLVAPQSTAQNSYQPPTPAPVVEEPEPVVEVEVNRIDILVEVIKEFEGFYAGSRAQVNNNPCNLRYSPYQSSTLAGFAYFDTYEDGRRACVHQITIAADGRSRVYHPDMTLLEFFNVYAPSSDNNQPSVYYEHVIKSTGFSRELTLKELL